MKSYSALSRRGRLRRFRQLAETALNSYNLGDANLTFLRYFANVTYRVDLKKVEAMERKCCAILSGRNDLQYFKYMEL